MGDGGPRIIVGAPMTEIGSLPLPSPSPRPLCNRPRPALFGNTIILNIVIFTYIVAFAISVSTIIIS